MAKNYKDGKKNSYKKKKAKVRKIITLIALLLVVVFVIVCYFNPSFYDKILNLFVDSPLNKDIDRTDYYTNEEGYVTIHVIDIGQGDAILIQLPDTKNILIDTGDLDLDNNKKLVDYINNLEITTIDYLLATHADADHIGGMEEVFLNFNVKKVFRPYVQYSGTKFNFESNYNEGATKYKQSSNAYGKFLDFINKEEFLLDEKLSVCEWEYFDLNSDFGGKIIYNDSEIEYTFDFLSPVTEYSQVNYEDANDYSPIIKFSYGDFDFLLTGDAEAEAEEDFVEYYSKNNQYKEFVDVDFLKVSHHGSSTSTTQAFLDLVKPEKAVISCGEGNSYGHPTQPTLDRLLEFGCSLYRTDKNGDVKIIVDSKGEFSVETQKQGTDLFLAPVA